MNTKNLGLLLVLAGAGFVAYKYLSQPKEAKQEQQPQQPKLVIIQPSGESTGLGSAVTFPELVFAPQQTTQQQTYIPYDIGQQNVVSFKQVETTLPSGEKKTTLVPVYSTQPTTPQQPTTPTQPTIQLPPSMYTPPIQTEQGLLVPALKPYTIQEKGALEAYKRQQALEQQQTTTTTTPPPAVQKKAEEFELYGGGRYSRVI